MSALLFTCNRYNRENTSNYILSIQLSLDGLSFCIRDYLSNCYIHFEHVPLQGMEYHVEEIRKEIERYKPDTTPYKKVYLIVDEAKYTAIPDNFKSKQTVQEFYALNYPVHKNDVLISSDDVPYGSSFIFPIKEEILDAFKATFGLVTIKHVADINLWKSKSYYKEEKGNILVHVFKKHFYLTVTKNKSLLLSNTYAYNFDNDVLFYTLNALTKLNLDQNLARVYISGNMKRDSALIKEMLRFVKHVDFEEWPAAYNYSDELFKMPPFYYSTLFIAPHCE